MNEPVIIIVEGEPRPKQSFRALKRGGGYTPPRVKEWQEAVGWRAREAMIGREPIAGPVSVRCVFVLSNGRTVDLDNLSKAVLDAIKGAVFADDAQVVNLHLVKRVGENPGVLVQVWPDPAAVGVPRRACPGGRRRDPLGSVPARAVHAGRE